MKNTERIVTVIKTQHLGDAVNWPNLSIRVPLKGMRFESIDDLAERLAIYELALGEKIDEVSNARMEAFNLVSKLSGHILGLIAVNTSESDNQSNQDS